MAKSMTNKRWQSVSLNCLYLAFFMISLFSFSSSLFVKGDAEAEVEEFTGGSGAAGEIKSGDEIKEMPEQVTNDNDGADLEELMAKAKMGDFTGGAEQASEMIGVTDDELDDRMAKLWPLIDVEGKGEVGESEVKAWLMKLRTALQKRQVAREVKTIDKDKDGLITIIELKAAYGSGSDASDDQMKEVEKRFKIVDKNKDGYLDQDDLSLLMEPAGDPELLLLETEEILNTQDKDKDGRIAFEEFMEGEPSEEDQAELKKEFNQYDVNQDGFIDRQEIGKVIADPHQHEVETALQEIKAYFQDGKLTAAIWKASSKQMAISSVTDNGEVLRIPEDYVGLDIPFKNVEKEEEEEEEAEIEHEELKKKKVPTATLR